MTHSETGTFCATFGVQYARTPHPTLPAAHPDGWLEVRGVTEEQALALVQALTGGLYAVLYREEEIAREFFPRGAIYVLEMTQP
jgi:hypothetical protein